MLLRHMLFWRTQSQQCSVFMATCLSLIVSDAADGLHHRNTPLSIVYTLKTSCMTKAGFNGCLCDEVIVRGHDMVCVGVNAWMCAWTCARAAGLSGSGERSGVECQLTCALYNSAYCARAFAPFLNSEVLLTYDIWNQALMC